MKGYLYSLISLIKNGQMVKKAFVLHKNKNICEALLNILWDEGFILGYQLIGPTNNLKIYLKYKNETPVISNIQIVSKPSLRIYYSIKNLWKLDTCKGLMILATNQGLKSINECKKLKLGGEPILIIK